MVSTGFIASLAAQSASGHDLSASGARGVPRHADSDPIRRIPKERIHESAAAKMTGFRSHCPCASELDALRDSTPDLACLDPLSSDVLAWLDRAYCALNKVDVAEGVILKLHEHYLLDPGHKRVAGEEIIKTIDRARRTDRLMHRIGLSRLT